MDDTGHFPGAEGGASAGAGAALGGVDGACGFGGTAAHEAIVLGEAAARVGGAADVQSGGADRGAEEVAAVEGGEGAVVHGCGSGGK